MDEEFEKQLRQLKKKHERIYVATVHEHTFIFRQLSRKEYDDILLWAQDDAEVEERVCETAVVFPLRVDWNKVAAGITPFLHREILSASGFHNRGVVQGYLREARVQLQSFYEQAVTTIATAFPQYKMEEIEEWTIEKLMKYLARAEWSLVNIHKKTHVMIREEESVAEGEEAPILTVKEIGEKLRDEGLDPMVEMGPPVKPPYVEYPLIGGLKVWEYEEVFKIVSEQVQRLSGQQTVLPTTPDE